MDKTESSFTTKEQAVCKNGTYSLFKFMSFGLLESCDNNSCSHCFVLGLWCKSEVMSTLHSHRERDHYSHIETGLTVSSSRSNTDITVSCSWRTAGNIGNSPSVEVELGLTVIWNFYRQGSCWLWVSVKLSVISDVVLTTRCCFCSGF